MTITESTTIADIARDVPSSVRVFQQHGIDFCCGGKRPMETVCREHSLKFADLVSAIDASCDTPGAESRDWSREPLRALVDHILTTYHQPLGEELLRLETMASKVAHAHGGRAPYLARLEAVVNELSDDLRMHMRKEEMILFPAIVSLEQGVHRLPVPVSAPIAMMEHEHDRAGELLTELRLLTDRYEAPEWGCATLRALYHGLETLESDMHVHVHLENNILFPRALQLAEVGVNA